MAAPGPTFENVFYVRRASADDVDTVAALFESSLNMQDNATMIDALEAYYSLAPHSLRSHAKLQRFIVGLIETSFMSVTVEDEANITVGFAALDDVPMQQVNTRGAGANWEPWFQATFGDGETDGMNSLWVSCAVVHPEGDIMADVMAEILQSTFSTHRDIQKLLVFAPGMLSGEPKDAVLAPFRDHFRVLHPVAETESDWAGVRPLILACDRSDVITPLFIRKARVEDHDNLVAVFDAQSEVVTDLYGDFFIAELIEAQNDENKALVAEVDGRAVGLMCFTSDVDINVLAQCFQLDPYDNLLKAAYMERLRQHAQNEADGLSPRPLCSRGDRMQATLMSADMDSLLGSVARHEDGRMTAAGLFNALHMRESTDDAGVEVPDFDKGVMLLVWQRYFWEPPLEGGSLIDASWVMESVSMFLGLHINRRREIAAAVLEQWDTVSDIFTLTQEARAAEEDARAVEEQPGSEHEDDEEEEDAKPLLVDLFMFLKALSEEQNGPFTQEFLAQLVMVLDWWTDEDLSSHNCGVPEDAYKAALEHILTLEEGLFVGHPSLPSWLANMPQHAKDVFCVNMCCLDMLYETQALDFLLPAFALYPNKDYCIITQPHTAPNSPLLNAFTIVPPQPQNTFSHVLYLIHRAALLGPPRVRSLQMGDQDEVPALIGNFDEEAQVDIKKSIGRHLGLPEDEALEEPEGGQLEEHVFVAEFDEQVVGLLILQMPASDVVATLQCCYHLDDYLLVEEHENHENRGHCRLVHFVVNPLFANYTRRLQQGALRLCGRTVLFMEIDLQSTISPVFRELLQVAPRRPPQLKKALRKPPRVATFANVPKEEPTQDDIKETQRQRLLRDSQQTSALSIVSKRLLSETKTPVNARIVVVGASDCGLSVLESLLSIPHLLFSSLTLLAPGGLEYHHSHHLPLIAGTAAYSQHELRRIMLELRVRILDSRMVQIDRAQKCCILQDQSILPYDYLIVAAGLQDDALHALKIRSCGMVHITDTYRSVNGAMSVADPSVRDLLVEGGTLIKSLIWNPLSYAVVYGRSLHAYCVVQGLLMRKVPPTKIILVLPPRLEDSSHQLPVDAFHEGDEVERKIHSILATMDMHCYDGYLLTGIRQDNRDRLKSVVLEDHSLKRGDGATEGGRDATDSDVKPRLCTLEDLGMNPNGFPAKLLSCRVLITADSVNVDPDIFNSVHGNGLVYDGRLIVDHNFKTTDGGIFGAGSLCEFSRRFQRKNAQRYLRHDGFNGREVGAKLAQALLRVLDPVNSAMVAAGAEHSTTGGGGSEFLPGGRSGMAEGFEGLDAEESSPELLPDFFMPIAKGGFLPGNLHYYRIHSCRRSDATGAGASKGQEVPPDRVIVTDTLDTKTRQGHFCRLTIDSFGKVDSIAYLGGEELQVESLWSLVGLSETFLNLLYLRWNAGDIPDIIEFLTDEWATALFHDRFRELCREINSDMLSDERLKENINNVLETANPQEGLSRKLLAQIRQHLPKESEKQMQDRLLKYLRSNTNHLKAYFLPENWPTERR